MISAGSPHTPQLFVSREMGIPCVVNIKEATKKLKAGQRVRVDGIKGKVYTVKS